MSGAIDPPSLDRPLFGSADHPMIVALPRVGSPAAFVLRRIAISQLQRIWKRQRATDQLTDRSVVRSTGRSMAPTDSLTERSTKRSPERSTDWLTDRPADGPTDRPTDRLTLGDLVGGRREVVDLLAHGPTSRPTDRPTKRPSEPTLDLALPSGPLVRLGPTEGRADALAHVHDDRLFLRLLLRGELGAGESFVAGEWSSDDLVGVIRMFLRATDGRGLESPLTWVARAPQLLRHRRAANTVAGSRRNIHAHYDLGNAFYKLFLDEETFSYSCAYWPDARMTLAEAQIAKLDRLCDDLELSDRDHLLEIGCGWGGMAIHAATTRGCKVTAITISREQHELARARVFAAGCADRVDVQLRDYRMLSGTFDKLVSIEMLEAVGYEFLPSYFDRCAHLLPPGGRFALQSITMPDDRFETYRRRVDWMQTYVFPGSLIPSLGAIRRAATTAGLRIARCEDIGASYAPTLAEWRARFLTALPQVYALGFDEPFVRTWLLYLAFSEAAFLEGTLGDHQLLLVR